MRRLRILVLMHAEVVPPDSLEGLPEDLREEMADSGMHSREIVDPDGHQWEFITT